MKTPSNELFDLIKSLSPAEISDYLKQNSDTAKSEYISLFKAMSKLKTADEGLLRRQLKFRNFKRVKHYLHQSLFDFLASCESLTIEREVMNLISVGNLLMDRSLFQQAKSIFTKAQKKAVSYQLNYHRLIIEEKLFFVNSHLNNREYVDYVLDGSKENEIRMILKSISIEEEMRFGIMKRWRFYEQNGSFLRTKEQVVKLRDLLKPYINRGEDYPMTYKAQHDYFTIAGTYYRENNEVEKAIRLLEQSAALAEKSNLDTLGMMPQLLVSLNNLLFVYARYDMHDKLRLTLDKVEQNLPTKPSMKRVGLVSLLVYESHYCKFVPDYPLRKKKIRWVESEYENLIGKERMQRLIQTVFNLSVIYFCDANFRKALQLINTLESKSEYMNFPSMVGLIKVYKLILYYEMDKHELLSFAFRNTYRYLLKNQTYQGFEKAVMKALKGLIKAPTFTEQSRILMKTYGELIQLKKDPYEKSVFQAFNYSGWIKCKLEKSDFKYVMTID